jgi:ABC-type transporter Mla subunit MlaD
MKPNYFKIGVFVIVAFVLILMAIVVFGAGLLAEDKIYFETYFNSSVSGLNIGAPMETRGVRMGQVEKITFARNEYELQVDSEDYYKYANCVIILISVDKENLPEMSLADKREVLEKMTSRGFRIRLSSNMLTGLASLEGNYLDPNIYPVLEVPWEPKHLYVSSAPGEFTTLKQSVDKILNRLEKIDTEKIGVLIEQLLVSVNKALDDANVPGISSGIQKLVANANQAIDDASVPALSDEIKNLFAEARQTNQHLQKLLKSPEKESQMANIAVMVAQFNKTLLRIDKLVASQTPQVEQVLEDLKKVSANLKELTESLKKHPSELIFSQPPPKSEALK